MASGAGISANGSGVQIVLNGAGTPTTVAQFKATVVRDATAFADLIDPALTPGAGDIVIRNLKCESPLAPDSGYIIYCDANSGIRFTDLKMSAYTRTTPNFYRWGCFKGSCEIDVQEWAESNDDLANPGVAIVPTVLANPYTLPFPTPYAAGNPGDYGLFRCYGSARIVLPQGVSTTNFTRYVIDANGNPVAGTGQVYLESTNGPAKVVSGLQVISAAFGGNSRISITNTAPTDYRTPTTAFAADGTGKTQVTGLACPVIPVEYTFYSKQFAVDWSIGMNQATSGLTSDTYNGTGPSNVLLQNGIAGSWYTLQITQDGSGNAGTVTSWGSNVRWQGGSMPTLTVGANKTDVFKFYFDGTSYFGQALLDF